MLTEASPAAIAAAAQALRAGALVAFPTETVYGLGADATNAAAVAAIFAAKDRPAFNPLIVHVADLDAAQDLGRFPAAAEALAKAFWPGPLTLVVPKTAACGIAELATAGLATVAVRVPAHRIARSLLAAAGLPLAAPSANRSGHVSPTTALHVAADLAQRVALILDGGPAPLGLESTVVDATHPHPVILRLGAITRQAIADALGAPVAVASGSDALPVSPGMLKRHYAPRAKLRLAAAEAHQEEALLAFGPSPPAHAGPRFNLSPTGDLVEAAANLFAGLRTLDAAGTSSIAVMPIPEEGLGEAINDRLRRAQSGA
jgi:L-threonylcarbamoyladenylate synthase